MLSQMDITWTARKRDRTARVCKGGRNQEKELLRNWEGQHVTNAFRRKWNFSIVQWAVALSWGCAPGTPAEGGKLWSSAPFERRASSLQVDHQVFFLDHAATSTGGCTRAVAVDFFMAMRTNA